MSPAIVAPLVIFVVLAAVFGALIRRAGRLLRVTREADLFRIGMTDLSGRIDQSLAGVVERVDELRRHQREPSTIKENLGAANVALERYAEEATALPASRSGRDAGPRLVQELERAGRALEMIEHGRALMENASRSTTELEAQTSIKRGYLNLIHAREAIAYLASESIAEATPAQRPLFRRGAE